MSKQVNERAAKKLHLRFRVFCGEDIALGPGKVQLLRLIRDLGSIRQAVADMKCHRCALGGSFGL